MPPAVEREYRIIYGAAHVGGDTDYEIEGWHHITRGKDTSEVRFAFTVQADTAEDFAARCYEIEEAFRTPYQDFLITLDGATILSLTQSGNTGLDGEPEISKTDDPMNTGRSRLYEVRLDFGAPADKASMLGRRESSVDVTYSASRRRTVTLSGVYTAVGPNDARAQWTAQMDTWATAILTALGGTYGEPVDDSGENSTNDKTLDFRRIYKEILRPESGAGTNDTGIVDPVLVISRLTDASGVSINPDAKRLVILEGRFESGIDADVTTDLEAKFASIRDWLILQIENVLDGGTMAVISFKPEYDEHENRIRATFTCWGLDQGSSSLVESRVTVKDRHEIGKEFVPKWAGSPYAVYIHDAPALLVRTVTWSLRFAADLSIHTAVDNARDFTEAYHKQTPHTSPHSPGGGHWELIDHDVGATPERLGIPEKSLDLTEVTAIIRYRWVVEGEGGGGGVTTPTPEVTPATRPVGSRTP